MWGIDVQHVTKKINLPNGKCEVLFEDFSLQIKTSETVGIFGPNGCGKTTLLNMISGLAKPDSGEILLFGEKPCRQKIAYVFQDYQNSLFPWLTVKENILFPLSLRKTNKKVMNEKLEDLQEKIKIPFDIDKYPYQLSGGQQQYLSILRGLVSDPAVMLFDEPFSALDYGNSIWLMEKMAEIMDNIKIPSILVVHDIEHLMNIAERICFLSEKPTSVLLEKLIDPETQKRKCKLDPAMLREVKQGLFELYKRKDLSYGWNWR
jgi:NitT/TauT family transport system ATP-binding protein